MDYIELISQYIVDPWKQDAVSEYASALLGAFFNVIFIFVLVIVVVYCVKLNRLYWQSPRNLKKELILTLKLPLPLLFLILFFIVNWYVVFVMMFIIYTSLLKYYRIKVKEVKKPLIVSLLITITLSVIFILVITKITGVPYLLLPY